MCGLGVEWVDERRRGTLNGQPGLLVFEGDSLTNAFVFDATNEGITAIYVVRNPEKLRRLSATP